MLNGVVDPHMLDSLVAHFTTNLSSMCKMGTDRVLLVTCIEFQVVRHQDVLHVVAITLYHTSGEVHLTMTESESVEFGHMLCNESVSKALSTTNKNAGATFGYVCEVPYSLSL